ncbi:hypothetical protein ACH4U6_12535 [Streptomyces netropsis]
MADKPPVMPAAQTAHGFAVRRTAGRTPVLIEATGFDFVFSSVRSCDL